MSFQAQGSKSVHPPQTRRKAAQVTPRGSPTAGSVRPGQGRAYGEGRAGQGKAGAELGRAPQAGPARPPPPHSQSKPSTGAGGAARNSPPQGGWRRPPATCLAPRRAALPAPSVSPAPAPSPSPSPPRHTCPPRPPNLASRLTRPRPLRPYWRLRPQLGSHWASPHRGGAAAMFPRPVRVSGISPW